MTRMITVPQPTSLAQLMRRKVGGEVFKPATEALLLGLLNDPSDAASLIDVSVMMQLDGLHDEGLQAQAMALRLHRLYGCSEARKPGPCLLLFVAPGDIATNAAIEFLIEGTDIMLLKLYVAPDLPLPDLMPEHHIALTAIGEGQSNRDALGQLSRLTASWSRPVLNDPERILMLARDCLYRLFDDVPSVTMVPTIRIVRDGLRALRDGALAEVGLAYPLTIRPLGSHGGKGFARIDCPADIDALIAISTAESFYVSRFVEYRNDDGLYRKWRIAFIGGEPLLCHKAISEHWIVHYATAQMDLHEDRRREEAAEMASFACDFCMRHEAGLRAVTERIGLDYFSIDCSELADGSLLIFEADVAAIVHDLDPVELYPYKAPNMRKLVDTFHRMVVTRSSEEAEARRTGSEA